MFGSDGNVHMPRSCGCGTDPSLFVSNRRNDVTNVQNDPTCPRRHTQEGAPVDWVRDRKQKTASLMERAQWSIPACGHPVPLTREDMAGSWAGHVASARGRWIAVGPPIPLLREAGPHACPNGR